MDIPLHEDLQGQVAFVTGASRGMGAAIADQLAAAGATVYAGARIPERVRSPTVMPVKLDVLDARSIELAVRQVSDTHDHLDILVNNAGIMPGAGQTLIAEPNDEIDAVLQTNLRGAVLVTKQALPILLRRPGARVINMSSGMGMLQGMNGGAPAYRISKAGLNGLTTYLHGDFHDKGLIANSVCPGWVRTDGGGSNATRSIAQGIETPLWLARFRAGAPSGHFWRDKEIIPW